MFQILLKISGNTISFGFTHEFIIWEKVLKIREIIT